VTRNAVLRNVLALAALAGAGLSAVPYPRRRAGANRVDGRDAERIAAAEAKRARKAAKLEATQRLQKGKRS
jgi:hypothetical protein